MYPNSIKVKNYKCFRENLEGFDKILPINIIIGKNNSGKSSLIDVIGAICVSPGSIKEIFSEYRPTYEEFRKDVAELYGRTKESSLIELYATVVKNLTLLYRFEKSGNRQFFKWPIVPELNKLAENYGGISLKQVFEKVKFQDFERYKFRRLNAERDINSEEASFDMSLTNNGSGATNIIQQFLNRKDLQKQKLIRKDFLDSINTIVKPEIEFVEVSVQISNTDSNWEICFEDKFGNNIFLSKMGSGIRTIILVLVNLLLIPSLEGNNIDDYIFAFEELENNLHPSLQRKLYQFVKQFAYNKKCLFFITTHSNIGIDIFYNSELSQLIAVNNINGVSNCKTIVQNQHLNELLNELGFKASDLLQTNGIIWVEGPSDRVYINRWLSLIDTTLVEGVHYSIMFYGGKLLSHLSFKEQNIDEFILLLNINKNSFVIIDKDAKKETDNVNKTKQRIQSEIGENNCWVTSGREIENYLPDSVLVNWLQSKNKTGCEQIIFGKFDKLEDALICISPSYDRNKSGYAKEISNFITKGDLNTLDLKTKIQSIAEAITNWNS